MDENDNVNNFPDLFRHLDPEPERANEQFLLLRRILIQGCRKRRIRDTQVEDFVHETLIRLCAQLSRIGNVNIIVYSLGILRNVIREGWRSAMKETGLDSLEPEPEHPSENVQQQIETEEYERRLHDCTSACVDRLPKEDGEIYLWYKQLSFHDRAKGDGVAASRGMSRTAFNAKISRTGTRLRDCIRKCMEKLGLHI